MSDFRGSCRHSPRVRTGWDACPPTARCWSFVADHRDLLVNSARTAQAVAGLQRLSDPGELSAAERRRGPAPP